MNGVTSILEEDFDDPNDPDVINLEETDHSVQIPNTEHLVHEDQNTMLAGRLTRSQVRLHICIFLLFIYLPIVYINQLSCSYLYNGSLSHTIISSIYLPLLTVFQAASGEADQDEQIAGPSTQKRSRVD